jgi:hypothetical protein
LLDEGREEIEMRNQANLCAKETTKRGKKRKPQIHNLFCPHYKQHLATQSFTHVDKGPAC